MDKAVFALLELGNVKNSLVRRQPRLNKGKLISEKRKRKWKQAETHLGDRGSLLKGEAVGDLAGHVLVDHAVLCEENVGEVLLLMRKNTSSGEALEPHRHRHHQEPVCLPDHR